MACSSCRWSGPAGLLLALAVLLAGCGGNGNEANQKLRGVVKQKNMTWKCSGPVDLDLVQITIEGLKKDALHLNRGCTGVIRRLEIIGDGDHLGPAFDGVKVHAGVEDLTILGGRVDCGRKAPEAHQDAIQVMGGRRVTFLNIESQGCANSFMFINWGRRHREKPVDVVCRDCRAESRNYSVTVRNSIRSGAIGGVYVSRLRPRATKAATDPVLDDNVWTPRLEAS